MDQREAINTVKRYKQALSEHLPVSKVYIYGSYAHHTQTENSDIDVAVLLTEPLGNYFVTIPKLWAIGHRVSTLIEPILIETENDPSGFFQQIMEQGIEITN